MPRVATAEMETLRALEGRTLQARYRLDEVLALGGMGAVFRARQLSLDKDVAVKVLHPQMAADEVARERFDREAEAASRLDHHNCIRIDDYGQSNEGHAYMAMELLEGAELSSLLGKPLPPARAVDLISQVLAGLAHAHSKGVVHRDLKPENVLVVVGLGGEETLKLVDFGIAKLLEGGRRAKLTRTGFVFGTPRYMSPEQARGDKLDGRADVYAAGLILYEMLTGWPPFQSLDIGTLLRKQVEAIHDPLPEETPEPLRKIVDKMLRKKPKDRYQTADDALEALAKIRKSLEGVEAAPKRPPNLGLPTGFADRSGVPKQVPAEQDVTLPADASGVAALKARNRGQSRRRSRRARSGWGMPALLMVVGFLGVGAYFLEGVPAEEGGSMERGPGRAGAGAHEDAGPVETVTLLIKTPGVEAEVVDPRDGRVHGVTNSEDGVQIPRSSEPVELVLSAPGYEDLVVPVVPDQDGRFTRSLKRVGGKSRKRPARKQTARPARAGKPSKMKIQKDGLVDPFKN